MAVARFSDATLASRREFLENRQKGIGGSDMPAILGLSPHKNALDVYYEKTRPITDADLEDDTIHQLRGHVLEATALAHYWLKTGRQGRATGITVAHPDYPAVRVHRDFEVFATSQNLPPYADGTGTGEIKSPMSWVYGKIIDDGLREAEIIQTLTNIAASRHSWGSIAYFSLEHSRGPIQFVDMPHDPKMGPWLLQMGQKFWDEHVVPRIPPNVDDWSHLLRRDDAPPIVDLSDPELVRLTDDAEYIEAIGEELRLKALVKDAETLYEAAKARLKTVALDRGLKRVHAPGIGKATVVTQNGRKTLQQDTLRHAMPLDRDKVERWLRNYIPDNATVGRMLFECTLDLDAFMRTGDGYQYVKTSPSKEIADDE